jgi:hypothetical protein
LFKSRYEGEHAGYAHDNNRIEVFKEFVEKYQGYSPSCRCKIPPTTLTAITDKLLSFQESGAFPVDLKMKVIKIIEHLM